MNPEQNHSQCAVCGESEPSFIHPVSNYGVLRRLCTDCLLKEHRKLFCAVCLDVFVDFLPPDACTICLNCPSIAHFSCSPPPFSSTSSSSASFFTCPPCSDPNFSFFPKYHVPRSDHSGESEYDGSETLLDTESVKAIVAAAKISVISMKNASAHLKKEAANKILEAKMAKLRAKEALGNLQDIVLKQKASENNNPNKRKNRDI